MLKKMFKFVMAIMLSYVFAYYIAGIIAQLFLGASEFYPPSHNAIIYLKDPHVSSLQLLILPAQLLRGLLIGLALFPFLSELLKYGKWKGSFLIGSIVLIVGYIAASGGLIEHLVYFKPEYYPARFALITLSEILIQTVTLSFVFMFLFRKEFNKSVG